MAEGGLEEFTGEGDVDLQIASQDFRRVEETRLKAGYLEGAAAGKAKCLQAGFNEGFARGVASALHWGMLRGRVSALQTHCTSLRLSEASQQLSALLQEITRVEEECRKVVYADQLEQYRQAVEHLQFDSNAPVVPAVLPAVTADSAPLSEVIKVVPPPPPTLAGLQKKLEEIETQLQLK